MIKKLIGSLLFAMPAFLAFGQAEPAPAETWQTTFFDAPTVTLPLLMAAAIRHSSQLKSIEIEKSINQQDMKLAKKNILGSVALGGTYTYGNLASVTLANPDNPNQFNTFSSSRYSTGVSVALPIDRLANRTNLIKKEELTYQHTEALRHDREDQIRQQIIQLYQNVLLAKKVLTLRQEGYVTVQTNSRLSEKQFRQGQLSLPELSQANVQLTEVSVAQELARNQYDTAFMLLEEIVGVRISSLIKTK